MEKMTSMDKFKDIDEVKKNIMNLGLKLIITDNEFDGYKNKKIEEKITKN